MKTMMMALVFIFYFGSLWAATDAGANKLWPREVTLKSQREITLFQPQVESFKGNKITGQSAFKITESKKEIYGSFNFAAKALVSKDKDIVSINEIQVQKVQVPQSDQLAQKMQTELQEYLNGQKTEVPYQSVINNLNIQVNEDERVAVKNDPPKFIFTQKPSILIMISGDPVWGESKGAKEVRRVMNTSALILHEEGKPYYVWALGKWFSSSEMMGNYKVAKDPSSKVVMIKDDLVKQKKVDPISGKTPDGKSLFVPNQNPEIVLSTVPAELLQSTGAPQYQAISGTDLLYMSNSMSSIFLESKTQNYFVLITGRWFMAKSLDGPWQFVSSGKLPADFKKIPVTSPVAEVLVSIKGTPQAKEGEIASSIPQMANVPKDLKPKAVDCDGKQKFAAMDGSSLKYASNCDAPVIEVTVKQYYLVQDGIWFTSEKPSGPWSVAIAVPEQIYKIPPSSPLFYVTYVHIYSVTDKYVTFGYTPGYHGTFVSSDGTIVYGTGYVYPTYATSTQWYPAPSTYGFGVGYADGFFVGYAMGSFMSPWGWGGCCWGGVYVNVNVTNVYHNWGTHTVISGPTGRGVTVNSLPNTKFYRGNNSDQIYAGHDGQVYRRDGKGDWSRNVGPNTWDPVQRQHTQNLDQMHSARQGGMGMRAGGGFHGGGGFRR